jgi:aspartate-semialdehyde dehydrogenase
MTTVGFVGWRGMVGSVLMERMREERDFDSIDPVFFTTSNVGGPGPVDRQAPWRPSRRQRHRRAREHDVLITCQGGDYTKASLPEAARGSAGGLLIERASALRMEKDRRHHPRPGEQPGDRPRRSPAGEALHRRQTAP